MLERAIAKPIVPGHFLIGLTNIMVSSVATGIWGIRVMSMDGVSIGFVPGSHGHFDLPSRVTNTNVPYLGSRSV